MAAPIAHIFLALKMLAGPLHGLFDEPSFIIGTSFPDIRYLGTIDRNKTHFKKVTLDQIKNEPDAFRAGMLFHSLVDEQRERYMQRQKVYGMLPKFKYNGQCLKLIEDLIIMKKFTPHSTISTYFDQVHTAELQFNLEKKVIDHWHKIIQAYLVAGPTEIAIAHILQTATQTLSTKQIGLYLIHQLAAKKIIANALNDQLLVQKIADFYFNFTA